MTENDQHDIAHSKMREAAERHASAVATDATAKAAHKKLAVLYGDRVIAARQAINAATERHCPA